MPKVGEKEFPYTEEGIAEAAKESSLSGIPVSNAADRAESYQLGGKIPGDQGFGQKPLPNPDRIPGTVEWLEPEPTNKFKDVPEGFMEKGGKVDKYKK